jgi:hypothetical protein
MSLKALIFNKFTTSSRTDYINLGSRGVLNNLTDLLIFGADVWSMTTVY